MLLRHQFCLARLVGGEAASGENYICPLFKMAQ